MQLVDPIEALMLQVEAGADEAIGLEPVDRLRRIESPRAMAPSPEPVRRAPQQIPSPSPSLEATPAQPAASDQILARAKALAASARSLDDLALAMAGFDGLALIKTATQVVFADGVPGSNLMIIGEAPGRDEDLAGKPFVGKSGQLLDRMLAAIGLDRTKVYIANVVAWRPPGNRKPTAAETAICRPFLDRQIELAAPKHLLLLGGAATSALLGREEGIMRLRGQIFDHQVGINRIPALATFHPAYLLRAPGEKRLAWRDFLSLKARLNQL